MKFGKRLKEESVPEWAAYYIQYSKLKTDIKKIQSLLEPRQGSLNQDKSSGGDASSNTIQAKSAVADFDVQLIRQVHTVGAFFKEELRVLEASLVEAERTGRLITKEATGKVDSDLETRIALNSEILLLEYIKLGGNAVQLYNFLRLNSEAIRKICKKFNKRLQLPGGSILNKLEKNPTLHSELMALKEYPSLLQPSMDKICAPMLRLLNELSASNTSINDEEIILSPAPPKPMSALAKSQGYSHTHWIRIEQFRQQVQGICRDCNAMRVRMENANTFLAFLSRGALLGRGGESHSGRSESVRWGSSIRAEDRSSLRKLAAMGTSSPAFQHRIRQELATTASNRSLGPDSLGHDKSRLQSGLQLGAVEAFAESDPAFKKGESFSHYLNLLSTFLYLANYNVCLPTSAEYAEHLGMQGSTGGVIVAMTPVAALFSAFVYSYASNYSFRNPLIVSSAFLVLGNAIYAAAWDTEKRYMLLLGRFVTGLGGCRAVNRRYIADTVTEIHRTKASAFFVAAGAVGMASGPLLAAIFSGIDAVVQGWTFNEVTGPAWVMCVIWVAYAAAVLFFFEEPWGPEEKAVRQKVGSIPATPTYHPQEYGFDQDKEGGAAARAFSFEDDYRSENDDDDDDSESLGSLLGIDTDLEATDSEEDNDSAFDDSIDIVLGTNTTSDFANAHGSSSTATTYGSVQGDFKPNRERLSSGNGFYAEKTGLLVGSKGISRETRVAKRRMQLTTLSLWVVLWMKLVQEALLTALPLQAGPLGWGTRLIGVLMASLGIIVVPANVALVAITRVYNLKDAFWIHYLLVMLFCSSLPLALIYDGLPSWGCALLLVICDAGIFVSAQVSEAVVSSFFSKVISRRLAAGTFNSGFLATEAGTFGRACGNALITGLGILGGAESLTGNLNRVISTITLLTLVATGLFLNKKHISLRVAT